jgi:hypothetical protein
METKQERVLLNAALQVDENTERVFDVLAITAGNGNGWMFSPACLKASLALWDGVEIFVDHHTSPNRSLRDLAGIGFEPLFDPEQNGIRLKIRPAGPSGVLLQAVGEEWLTSREPRPRLGFSADLVFLAEGALVKEIRNVLSLDLVYRPARGGVFTRVLNQLKTEKENMSETNNEDLQLTPQEGVSPNSGLSVGEAQAMRNTFLSLKLQESQLPEAMKDYLRKSFKDCAFTPEDLEEAIQVQQQLLGELENKQVIQGGARITEMRTSAERLQAAADDLFGAPRDAGLQGASVEKLSGIRELYLTLTGDVNFTGKTDPQRVQLASSASLPYVLKNSFNKLIVQQWDELGRAGYRWWEKVVQVEHMNSLQQVSGILLGEVSALGAVNEGASYGELTINDSGETKDFQKFGGLLPVTLEMIDKDETHKLRQLPRKLVSSAVRNISALVSDIFTTESGAGPVMGDGYNVFNATQHQNLGTAALSAASFEAASQAIYQQSLVSLEGSKPRLAVDARYLLVPRALRLTARQILYPAFEREANIFSENMQRGELGDVITVPEWTDNNNWAAMADPLLAPSIILAERFGLMPEIFVAEQETGFDMLHSDTINLKVRHFLAVFVADYRPLYKANVA